MTDPVLVDILESCRGIDVAASGVYRELAQLAGDEELKGFWLEMAAEELEHVGYWEGVLTAAREMSLPRVFPDPAAVLAELHIILPRAERLLERCRGMTSLADAFLLSCRLEFFMLHPAFGTLFTVLKPAAGWKSPEAEYERHIDRFVEMLARREDVSPELALVAEALRRLRSENRDLVHSSTHDPLTDLYNRGGFFTFALQMWLLARRHRSTVGVLLLDVDRLKEVNDSRGHAAGDAVLVAVAQAIRSSLRQSDIVARLGGDEFVGLLPDVAPGMLRQTAEKVCAAVRGVAPPVGPVTVSVGAACAALHPEERSTLEQLIHAADGQLYEAKRLGRDRVVA